MIRTHLGRSRVRDNRMLGSVGAKLNGLATRPSPPTPRAVRSCRARRGSAVTLDRQEEQIDLDHADDHVHQEPVAGDRRSHRSSDSRGTAE